MNFFVNESNEKVFFLNLKNSQGDFTFSRTIQTINSVVFFNSIAFRVLFARIRSNNYRREREMLKSTGFN